MAKVVYNFKQSVSASGGIGFDLLVEMNKGDTKEEIIELGNAAIEACKELMRKKLN